jgi:DNA invertase Pin-like site-specific DNA recombinase
MTEKAIAYLRVSSDRQDEHSFDTQFRNIREYLEGKKWTMRNERLNGVELELDTRLTCKLEKEGGGVFQADGCFAEKGSAYDITNDREQFNEMVRFIKKQRIN